MEFLPLSLSRAALRSTTRAEFRQLALELLLEELQFDAGLFVELGQTCGALHAAAIGVEQKTVVDLCTRWEGGTDELDALRFRALKQAGVATDSEAFSRNREGRQLFRRLVADPMGVASMMGAHLVIQERLVSVIFVGRKAGAAVFSPHERRWLASLVPVLAACEAVHARHGLGPESGLSTVVRCVDRRLTKRQREVVEQVALGRTNREAGESLGISEHTVRNLLVEARARLQASNRAELVRLAVMG